MKRSPASDSRISLVITSERVPRQPVKASSTSTLPTQDTRIKAEQISPYCSDDEDDEDYEDEDDQDQEDEEPDEEEDDHVLQESVHTQNVVFNTSTADLEKIARRSIININNIVNINNGNNNTNTTCTTPSHNCKIRSESFPLSEVELLRQQLREQKKGNEKLKKHNQMLAGECEAMKKILETEIEQPKISPSPPISSSYAVVKVGYLIKRGYTWHNWCSRWCVLRWNTLTYWKSPSDAKPKGLFHVQGCEVAEHNDPRRPHTFTVQSRNRLWYFQATNLNEQRSWMQAIRTAAQEDHYRKPPEAPLSTTPPKSGKLFRFFGEEPTKDWSEEDRARYSLKNIDFMGPVPNEISEFVSEKEARVIDECGLSLKQVHAYYHIFLGCAYFVTRDRYFKKRISEYNTMFKPPVPPLTRRNTMGSIAATRQSRQFDRASRRSAHYSDATIGKMLCMQNPRDHYTFCEKVGKGGFANVFRAKNKSNKNCVAVKVLSQKFEKHNTRMCHEVSMLMTCNHPNIIKNVQNFLYNEEIYMVTEYCEIGSLERIIKLELTEPAIAFIIGQVIHGLNYLHGMGRVHRDIKSSNILVNSLGQVKIADLGLCEELKHGPIMGKMSGSKYWLAPEVISRQPYGTPVDIWNVGALGCAMVTKSPPNGSMHPVKAMYLTAVQGVSVSQILPKTQEWSNHFRDFLSQCFQLDPAARPTAAALLQHPFLKLGRRADLVPLVNACLIAGYIV